MWTISESTSTILTLRKLVRMILTFDWVSTLHALNCRNWTTVKWNIPLNLPHGKSILAFLWAHATSLKVTQSAHLCFLPLAAADWKHAALVVSLQYSNCKHFIFNGVLEFCRKSSVKPIIYLNKFLWWKEAMQAFFCSSKLVLLHVFAYVLFVGRCNTNLFGFPACYLLNDLIKHAWI